MKHASRPQIHAYALAALLLFVVALSVALAMLGHATMAGGPQWSAGALAGTAACTFIIFFITLIVGATAAGEWLTRGRQPEPNAGLGFVDAEQAARNASAWFEEPEDAPYNRAEDEAAFWAQTAAHQAVHELDEARVDELVRQRSHHRAARRSLTHHGH